MAAVAKASWTVYIVRCADGTLYTGVARDVQRRLNEHNSVGALAAKYTRSRLPVALVHQEQAANRSAACKREHEIKSMTRQAKLELIQRTARRLRASGKTSGKPGAQVPRP